MWKGIQIMSCKSICVRYKATGRIVGGRYFNGQKRCQECEIWIRWEGLWCPCCGQRLRTKPRNVKFKASLKMKLEKLQ